eukprot:jgi/Picre1/30435/NNA_005799.t1
MEVGFRRPRHKKRYRHDIQNDRLKIYEYLRESCLKGILMDAAVWICVSDDVVKQLDYACFGNLDGGHGMTAYIRDVMSSIGVELPETCRNTVRLSLDEAFFMHYALKVLDLCKVDITSRQPSQILDTKQIWEYMAQGALISPYSTSVTITLGARDGSRGLGYSMGWILCSIRSTLL